MLLRHLSERCRPTVYLFGLVSAGIINVSLLSEATTMAKVGQQQGARLRSWTRAEYYRMGELGFFRGQRVELLDGRIMLLDRLTPGHIFGIETVRDVLSRHVGSGLWVRLKAPLDLGKWNEPEPDLLVAVGKPDDYRNAHPTTAALIVEIGETASIMHLRRKGGLYARAGIQDYWIVNLVARQLEVYRTPIPDPRRRFGHRYSMRADLLPTATVSPLALPQAVIPVADLLPA
jgi:Uma2 family endonuclease